ncbi:hypothetical protein [Runella salmonicolor]|uniref:Uncharacterized protein n=1 Tax=Runella salmonicolor TaxID=2950278 RepID=A0ABT1FGN4_9BACT|nr:hypothetical protein [Runella salmonicolor]MCP1380926.1 hypothetical protein [Runella salmonicolor]
MKLFKWSILIAVVVFLLYPREQPFGEFEINDVSKAHYFVDSVSTDRYDDHANVEVSITGEIDSAATISYASLPENYGGYTYKLKKGDVNIFTQYDFYGGDKIWIKFEPKGSKKGKLKIKTQIH